MFAFLIRTNPNVETEFTIQQLFVFVPINHCIRSLTFPWTLPRTALVLVLRLEGRERRVELSTLTSVPTVEMLVMNNSWR